MDTKVEAPSAEEIAAEQAATQLPKEDEVRAQIIADYGFDEAEDADRIDRLTKKEMDHREKLSGAIGQKIKYRELAKKVPPEKKEETVVVTPPAEDLSTRDTLAIMNAKVPEEDVDTVIKWAKVNKISVTEALKDKDLNTVLERHAEERRTDEATQAGRQNRGATRPTGEDLLAKAEQTGEVPDTDEGMQDLFNARIGRKLNRGPKRR